MEDAQWHRGAGGGVFLIASIVRINLDIAHGLKTGDTQVHLSSGFTFLTGRQLSQARSTSKFRPRSSLASEASSVESRVERYER